MKSGNCADAAHPLDTPAESAVRASCPDFGSNGAGSCLDPFELILDEGDCRLCGGILYPSLSLGGAYSGLFPVYDTVVRIPALGFAQRFSAVGVPSVPSGFDGIACFRFLNHFTYGNFGDPGQFGLEC
jgi:hypothetical protein